ncbi:FkbM family methyltransferase [Mucilaginibacter terrenus]|uniref:FkbM family methyltransferase n=1 Tax=Mucilaginibacter terrenus TaxID=2482727 RepID=A0A3E2NMD2_9SPHI|nr:FkbM family methyltransferase [Mucilaginibacter terrenus]RFZ82050.1 FkbM family methyltransferase [Mucilaginibacter terrenus]
MNIKKFIPNSIKQEGKYLLYRLLKIPYNRSEVPVVITAFLPADKPINVMDVGASKGNFMKSVANYYQINKAVLVEPLTDLKAILNEKFPDKSRFVVESVAVSDKSGSVDFYYSKDADVLSSILKIKDEYHNDQYLTKPTLITVETETLDTIANRNNLNVIDLLKIDVQGVEHLVLMSGLNTLKRTKLVYTEISYKPMYEGSSTFFDLFKILTECNFRLVNTSKGWVNPDGEIIQGDALFVNNALL